LFEAIGGFLRSWRRLLATDVVYKLVAAVVLIPLTGVALSLFLSTSGSAVVADQDILYFVLSPIGIVALLVMGAVMLAIVALEQACLMTIDFGETRRQHVTTTDALRHGARHAWRVVVLAFRVFLRALLIALPFLVAGGLVFVLLLGEHDINYYLAERPPIFLIAAGAMAALGAVMAVLVVRRLLGWSLSLPLVLFEQASPGDAMTTSTERVRGHRRTVAFVLVAWGIAAAILSAVPLALVRAIGVWLVPKFTASMTATVVVMGGILLLWGVVNLLVSLINAVMFALLAVRLYDRLGAAEQAQLSEAEDTQRPYTAGGRPMSIRVAVAALAVAAVLAAIVGAVFLSRVRTDDDAVVIAHRGAAGRAPENTPASVAAALEDGADIVEIDVQETSDGEVIVVHDADLMRVGGNPTKIWDGSFDELRAIDVGAWYGAEFTGQRVPTLEEVLELCRGRAKVNIELKDYGHGQRLEERVAEIVERVGAADQVILMSLSATMVRNMKALRPDWTVGLLTAKAVGDLTRADADFLAIHTGIAQPGFIRRAHRTGKEVYVWTVNDRINMSRMLSRGVDGIITDHPAQARQVLVARTEMSAVERLLVAAAFWIGLEPKEPPPEQDLG
jgi:glycerophosphoryl diester phosphodiesterase